MGLSNQERLRYMFGAVNALNKIKNEWHLFLKDGKHNQRADSDKIILALLDDLWPSLIGSQSNSVHWILGSSSSNPIQHDPNDCWTMAITHHLDEAGHVLYYGEKSYSLPDDDDRPFNATQLFEIEKTISKAECSVETDQFVFKTYKWLEQLIYGLRRYNDKMIKNYEVLDRLISRIQGECFDRFLENEDFARAFLLEAIVKFIYGDKYPYNEDAFDVVTKLAVAENLQHEAHKALRVANDAWHGRSVEFLAKLHVSLVLASEAKWMLRQKETNEGVTISDELKAKLEEEDLRQRFIAFLGIHYGVYKNPKLREKVMSVVDMEPAFRGHRELLNAKLEEFAIEDKRRDKTVYEEADRTALHCYPFHGYSMASKYFENVLEGNISLPLEDQNAYWEKRREKIKQERMDEKQATKKPVKKAVRKTKKKSNT